MLVRPRAGIAQHLVQQPAGRDRLAEVRQHRRVRPERQYGQVVPGQFGGQRADGGGHGAHPLAAHRAGHVGQQHDAAPGADPLPDDDVLFVRHRMLGQLLDGAVQVDVVAATPVPDAGQLTDAAPGGDVPARPGHGQPGGDLPGPAQRLRVGRRLAVQGIGQGARLVGDSLLAGDGAAAAGLGGRAAVPARWAGQDQPARSRPRPAPAAGAARRR